MDVYEVSWVAEAGIGLVGCWLLSVFPVLQLLHILGWVLVIRCVFQPSG
jgi:hypothetical protein